MTSARQVCLFWSSSGEVLVVIHTLWEMCKASRLLLLVMSPMLHVPL
jgi:hypothetical protein